jgi:hypothetical protein
VAAGAQFFHGGHVLPVVGIVDKSSQVDPVVLGHVLEQVPGTDLVALVGRVRDPMDQQ